MATVWKMLTYGHLATYIIVIIENKRPIGTDIMMPNAWRAVKRTVNNRVARLGYFKIAWLPRPCFIAYHQKYM